MKKPTVSKKRTITTISIFLIGILLVIGVYVAFSPPNPSVYLDDLPSSYSYTIKTDGSNYWAVRYDGRVLFDSMDADYTINSARNALGSLATGADGGIFITKGTYSVNNDIIIGKQTHLIAEVGTKLDVTANLNVACIDIDDSSLGAGWRIENLEIDLNSYNGDGIHSDFATKSDCLNILPVLRNLYIHDVKAGYDCIDLTNILNIECSNLRLRTSGTGLKLRTDDSKAVWTGNSWFNNVRVGVSASSAIGFDIGGGTSYANIFLHFIECQVTGGGQSGTIGIKIRGLREASFTKFYVEQIETGLDIAEISGGANAFDLQFYSPTIRPSGSSPVGIHIGASAYGIQFFGGMVVTSGKWLDYDNNVGWGGTIFYATRFEGGGSMDIGGDTNVTFDNTSGYP